jgi:hypothetical protein
VYKPTNTNKENILQELHASRPSASEVQNPTGSSSDELVQKQAMQRGPKQDYPSRPSTDFTKCKPDTTAAGGKGKKQCPARRCKACCK